MVNTGNSPNDIDDINDFWYALDQGGLLSDTISDDVDDAIKTRNYSIQPDGDLVGQMATGQLFDYDMSLDAHETFTSDWFDTDGFSSIEFFVQATQPSEPEGVRMQFTDDVQADNVTVEAEQRRTFDEKDVDVGYRIYKTETNLDGIRMVYDNNSDPADIRVIGTAKIGLSLDGANYVTQNTMGNNQIRVGTDMNGQGLKVGNPSSLFGDVVTITRSTLIDIASSFGTSTVNDEIFSSGSGSITQDPDPDTGEIVLSTGTTADSSIELRTAEYGRYTPGFSGQQGVGIRIPNPPTEGEARWGYFDDDNGFYWGYDGGQGELFVARRSNGVETERIYRSDWNRNSVEDVLDRPFNIEEGSIFQIDFSWYGYGIIQFSIVSQTSNDLQSSTPRQDTVLVHAISVTNETSTTDPNQPITVEAENAGTGEDYELRVGGRQYSVFGQPPSGNRVTSETALSTTIANGDWTHIMSWRRDQSGVANARLNIDGIDFAIDQTSRIAFVINGNVSGTTFTTPSLTDPDETLLEVSTDGTFDGLGSGTKVWEGTVSVAGTGQAEAGVEPDIDLSLGQNNTVSLIAQADGDTGDALTTMRMVEDW